MYGRAWTHLLCSDSVEGAAQLMHWPVGRIDGEGEGTYRKPRALTTIYRTSIPSGCCCEDWDDLRFLYLSLDWDGRYQQFITM